MSRGREDGNFRRDARLGGALPLEQQLLALLPYSWIEADTYTVDGVSGNVASFPDKVASGTGIRATTPSHAYTQATSARQVAIPATDAKFNNKVSAALTNAYYQSNSTAGEWTFAHNGSGVTEYYLLSTNSVATSNLYISNTQTANTQWAVKRDTSNATGLVRDGAGVVIIAFSRSGVVVDTGQVWRYSYLEGRAPNEYLCNINNGADNAGNSSGAPSANPAGKSQGIFAYAAASAAWTGHWAAKITFNRILTTGEDTLVRSYIRQKYGV